MDPGASPRLAAPDEFPGVLFGVGVVVYGRVHIRPGSRIGDYTIIGVPTCEDMRDGEDVPPETLLGDNVSIGPHCVIHAGVTLGPGVLIQNHCSIGSECVIGGHSRILYAAQLHWRVTAGAGSIIGGFCCDRASIGDSAIMLGKLIHRLEDPTASWDDVEEPSPVVEARAVVGFDALVIGGVTVRSGSYVAAGAVVTKDVLPGTRVVGTTHYSAAEWSQRKGLAT